MWRGIRALASEVWPVFANDIRKLGYLIAKSGLSDSERHLLGVEPIFASGTARGMPFPEPETAKISPIECEDVENLIPELAARPAAFQTASTTFQSLTPERNNLQIISITWRQCPGESETAFTVFSQIHQGSVTCG